MSNLIRRKEGIERGLLLCDPSCKRFLYHGTGVHEPLDQIEPRLSKTFHTAQRGSFVFATTDFLTAAQYSCRIVFRRHAHNSGVPRIGSHYAGVKIMGAFTMAEGSACPGSVTRYALVNRLADFEDNFQGGSVYGLSPEGFQDEAGEFVSEYAVKPLFRIAVKGLDDLMAAGVQLFEITNPQRTVEVDENWPLLNDPMRAYMLDPKNDAEGGLFRWINKDAGFEVPAGLMHNW